MIKLKITKNHIFLIGILMTLITFNTSLVYAQKELNYDETLHFWIKSKHNRDKSKIIGYDSDLNRKLLYEIDSLKKIGCDSIFIFIESTSGSTVSDSCFSGFYPSKIKFLWLFDGKCFEKSMSNKCQGFYGLSNKRYVFDFLLDKIDLLKEEHIVPVIYKASITKDNKFVYKFSLNHNEPKYCLFWEIGEKYRIVDFTESSLQDKKSMFYEHNLNSELYLLYRLSKSLLK